MKFATCRNCRHKLFSLLYEPKFCRACGARNLKVYSLLEWLILAVIVCLTIRFFYRG